jgi:hypothetical protein
VREIVTSRDLIARMKSATVERSGQTSGSAAVAPESEESSIGKAYYDTRVSSFQGLYVFSDNAGRGQFTLQSPMIIPKTRNLSPGPRSRPGPVL